VLVHFHRQCFDALGERFYCFRELGILLHHLQKERRLLCCNNLPLHAHAMEILAVCRVGDSVGFITIGLTGLRKQNEWCRISCLQAESKVEEDKRVDIKRRESYIFTRTQTPTTIV